MQKVKKNVMMRVASGLGVAVLLTTCAISGTFAKYTSSVSGTDQARVAKWGFEAPASIEINDLFSYSDSGVLNTDGTVTGLIAPGTTNSETFGFSYDTTSNSVAKPEVAYTFTVAATGECGNTIKNNSNIKWYLDNALAPAYTGTGTDADPQYKAGSWDALIQAINALDGEAGENGKTYAANTLPTAFYGTTINGAATHSVKWEWVYETADDTTTTENEQSAQDTTDTGMGNADDLAEVKLTITITATQVDTYTPATPTT